MARLAEEELLDVVVVDARPAETLAERLAAESNERTAAVLVSAVLEGLAIVPGLNELAAACQTRGAELLVDVYHALGVMSFPLDGLGSAWVVGGGYKYLQLGEGNCFSACRLTETSCAALHGVVRRVRRAGRGEDAGRGRVPTGRHALRRLPRTTRRATTAARVFDFFQEQASRPRRCARTTSGRRRCWPTLWNRGAA